MGRTSSEHRRRSIVRVIQRQIRGRTSSVKGGRLICASPTIKWEHRAPQLIAADDRLCTADDPVLGRVPPLAAACCKLLYQNGLCTPKNGLEECERRAFLGETMRTLSIQQPFAQLVVRGMKLLEVRPQDTDYRGRIAIHASAAVPPKAIEKQWKEDRDMALRFADEGWLDREDIKALPRSAIIGTVELVGVHL
jgi:hypothetical protein